MAEGRSRAGVRDAFDSIAEEFDAARQRPWREVEEFVQALGPGSRVVDLGCGNGRHLRLLAGAGMRGIGLDASRALLQKARESGPVACGDLARLPFLPGVADAGLLVACLHHLGSVDRHRALGEARRVLRHGGRLLVSVWCLDQPRFSALRPGEDGRGVDTEVPWTRRDGETIQRFYHLYVDGELPAEMARAGLHVEKYFRATDNYFAVGKRHG